MIVESVTTASYTSKCNGPYKLIIPNAVHGHTQGMVIIALRVKFITPPNVIFN